METLTLWPGAACCRVCERHSDWTSQCPITRNMQCWGTACLRALWPGCSAAGTSVSLAPEESTAWAQPAGFAPSARCRPSFLGPMQRNFLLPPPPLQKTSDFFKVFLCCLQKHQLESWNSLLGKWLNFKVLFSSRCDAVRLLPLFAYKPRSRIELAPFRGWHGMLFLISSYCLPGVAYPGLVFFSVIACINRPLTAA